MDDKHEIVEKMIYDKIDYDWIEPLPWHSGKDLNFEYKPADEFRNRFANFPAKQNTGSRYAFLLKKSQIVTSETIKPTREFIHSLAYLGYLLSFGVRPGLDAAEFQNQLLPEWVRKNGMPICTAQLPYHRMITTCEPSIRKGVSLLRPLIDYWPMEHEFEINNPDYFLMFDSTLRAFALYAFVLYSEVCIIFDPKFKKIRKKTMQFYQPTIGKEKAAEELFKVGSELFANDKFDAEIQEPTSDSFPLQPLILYGDEFKNMLKSVFSEIDNKGGEGKIYVNMDNYLMHVFTEIENYLYRVHLRLKAKGEIRNWAKLELQMLVTVPDLLSLAWLELFLIAKNDSRYGMRICEASDCPYGFFTPTRTHQIFCCTACRNRHNNRERRK